MIPKTLRSFISRLHEATDDGDVSWAEGAPEAYYCNHKEFTLHLSYHFDHDTGESAFHFLMKSGGKDAFFSVTSDESDYIMMKNLYASVGVKASGFDDIADKFFA